MKKVMLLIIGWILFESLPAFASGSLYTSIMENPSTAEKSYSDFESIDNHTGKVVLENKEFSIKVDGDLNFIIARSYQKQDLPNYEVPDLMGNWALEIPRIEMNSGDVYTEQAGCSNPNPGRVPLYTVKYWARSDTCNEVTTKVTDQQLKTQWYPREKSEKINFSSYMNVAQAYAFQCENYNDSFSDTDYRSDWETPCYSKDEVCSSLSTLTAASGAYKKFYPSWTNFAQPRQSVLQPIYEPRAWLGVKVHVPGQDVISLQHFPKPDTPVANNYFTNARWIDAQNGKASCINIDNSYGIKGKIYKENARYELFTPKTFNNVQAQGFQYSSPNGIQYSFNVGPSITNTNERDFNERELMPNSIYNKLTAEAFTSLPVSTIFHNSINKLYYYPSEIKDKNGNWIRFEYINTLAGKFIAGVPITTYGNFIPKRIYASNGLEAIFDYHPSQVYWRSTHPVNLIKSMTIKPIGGDPAKTHVWQYHYDSQGQLITVILPDGISTWKYSYHFSPQKNLIKSRKNSEYSSISRPAIKTVTTPTGALYSYDYTIRNVASLGGLLTELEYWRLLYPNGAAAAGADADFDNANSYIDKSRITSLKTRTITGTGISIPQIQSYSYSNDGYLNRTHISNNDVNTVFYFSRLNDWGLLKRKEIYSSLNNRLLEKTDYTWTQSRRADFEILKNPKTYLSGQYKLHGLSETNRISKIKVTRGSQIFNTVYSDFDINYLFPKTVQQSYMDLLDGSKSKLREMKLTYYNDSSRWLIAQPQDTYIGNKLIKNIGYNSLNGSVIWNYDLGVHHSYGYASMDKGNISYAIDYDNVDTFFSDYYNGVPRLVKKKYYVNRTNLTDAFAPEYTKKIELDYVGNVVSEVDFRFNKTIYGYDKLNRISSITPPRGLMTSIEWTSPTKKIETRGGLKITTNYNAIGQIIEKIQEDINSGVRKVRGFSYDAKGRLKSETKICSVTPCIDNLVTYDYDSLDRIITKKNLADNSTISYLYDHNKTIETTSSGSTIYEYTYFSEPDNGKVTKISPPAGSPIVIDYDELNNIKTITQGSIVRNYTYDSRFLNKVKTITEPEKSLMTLYYNSVGLPIKRTIGSDEVNYEYDTFGQPTRELVKTANIIQIDTYNSYDPNGNISLINVMTNTFGPTSKWHYGYNSNNQRNKATHEINGYSMKYIFDYDQMDSLEKITYPSGYVIYYNPDVFGRPTIMGDFIKNITYHSDDKIKSLTFGNGVVQNFSEDAKYRVDGIAINRGNQTLAKENYTYYAGSDNRKTLTTLDSSKNYEYDPADRLRFVKSNTQLIEEFNYDGLDNMNQRVRLGSLNYNYKFNPVNNRLDSYTDYTGKLFNFGYDAKGNITSKNTFSYKYDPLNNLTEVLEGGLQRGKFGYDGNNHMNWFSQQGKAGYVNYIGEDKFFELYPSDNVLLERYYLMDRPYAERQVKNIQSADSDKDGISDATELKQ